MRPYVDSSATMQHAQINLPVGRNDRSCKARIKNLGYTAHEQNVSERARNLSETLASQSVCVCPICGRVQYSASQKQGTPRICPERRCQEQVEQGLLSRREGAQQSNTSARRAPLQCTTNALVSTIIQSPPRLITTAEDLAIEGRFWSCFMPMADHSLHSFGAVSDAGAPYQMLREITSGSELVKRCAQAMAFANLGRENDDRRLNLRGAQIYHAVLRQTADRRLCAQFRH